MAMAVLVSLAPLQRLGLSGSLDLLARLVRLGPPASPALQHKPGRQAPRGLLDRREPREPWAPLEWLEPPDPLELQGFKAHRAL